MTIDHEEARRVACGWYSSGPKEPAGVLARAYLDLAPVEEPHHKALREMRATTSKVTVDELTSSTGPAFVIKDGVASIIVPKVGGPTVPWWGAVEDEASTTIEINGDCFAEDSPRESARKARKKVRDGR